MVLRCVPGVGDDFTIASDVHPQLVPSSSKKENWNLRDLIIHHMYLHDGL
jgi:hypothetical protein